MRKIGEVLGIVLQLAILVCAAVCMLIGLFETNQVEQNGFYIMAILLLMIWHITRD